MTSEELVRAKKADLIYIPQGLAERCSNCKYLKNSFCEEPRLKVPIVDPPNECCGYWDNDKIDRTKNLSKKGSDTASFDVHQTDPARLKAEIKKDMATKSTWECEDCGEQVKSVNRPGRSKCGGYKWKKV